MTTRKTLELDVVRAEDGGTILTIGEDVNGDCRLDEIVVLVSEDAKEGYWVVAPDDDARRRVGSLRKRESTLELLRLLHKLAPEGD